MTGLKISQPLSKELRVGFSQNVPGNSPVDPAPSRRSAPAQNARPAPVTMATQALVLVTEAGEGGVEIAPHLAVDRVERVGAVVRDRRDMTVLLVEHRITHGPLCLCPGRATAAAHPRRLLFFRAPQESASAAANLRRDPPSGPDDVPAPFVVRTPGGGDRRAEEPAARITRMDPSMGTRTTPCGGCCAPASARGGRSVAGIVLVAASVAISAGWQRFQPSSSRVPHHHDDRCAGGCAQACPAGHRRDQPGPSRSRSCSTRRGRRRRGLA